MSHFALRSRDAVIAGRWIGALCALIIVSACASGRLPAPNYRPQPQEALQEVAFPPPPARVEYVPAKPDDDRVVWIDGEWVWQEARWSWKAGRWVIPPAGGLYSPWTATRGTTGLYYVAPGRWTDGQGNALEEPSPVTVARSRGGRVVDPNGEDVVSGPNVRSRPGAANSPRDAGSPERQKGAEARPTERNDRSRIDGGS